MSKRDDRKERTVSEKHERDYRTAKGIVTGLGDALKAAAFRSVRQGGLIRSPIGAIRSAVRQAPVPHEAIRTTEEFLERARKESNPTEMGRIDELATPELARLLGNAQLTWMFWGLMAAGAFAGMLHGLFGSLGLVGVWRINVIGSCGLIVAAMLMRMLIVARDIEVLSGQPPRPARALINKPGSWVPFSSQAVRDPVIAAYTALVLLVALHAPVVALSR